jgi:predicted RNA binding protein YcfA (HicA-like mRNA interferase family)
MSRRLPALTPAKVIAALKRGGFFVHHVSGSHYLLRHANRPGVSVTVAKHRKDLKRGTLGGIIKQAGLSVEAFLVVREERLAG